MTRTRRMLKTLASLLPLGALGVSIALAATPAKPIIGSGNEDAASRDVAGRDVAGRLRAIRAAVSEVTAEQAGLQPGDPNIQKAWWGNWRPGWWGNGGWRNWHNGWGNGGWGNGGWGNGGWGNGGWHNCHNGWGNW
jgi:rSAM-associated Gly-rich repeat protein